MKKTNFYIFGNTHWSFFPHREHHIAVELAKRGHAVHFVEELPSIPRKLRGLFKQNSLDSPYYKREDLTGLKIYKSNTILTFFKSSIAPKLDRKFFRYWFDKKFITQIESPSVLIITVPVWFYLLGERTEFFDRIVYDVCDDLRISARNQRALNNLKTAEAEGIFKADVVTASAPGIIERLHNDYEIRPVLIRNGIEENFFPEKPIVPKNQIFVIGLIGVFDVQPMLYDLELIREAASTYPDYKIVLLGRISKANKATLEEHQNIECTGVVSNEELRRRLGEFDICLIPFLKSETVASINPLKLYEYLAYGKPVIATNNFDPGDLREDITIADSKERFIAEIENQLNTNSFEKVNRRIEAARQNTWGNRTEILLQTLEK